MNIAIVVASNRPAQMQQCLDAWMDQTLPAQWFVVWDLDETPVLRSPLSVTDWNRVDIATVLGNDHWIIPRKTAAARSFGFLIAYCAGAEVIVSLDDDVRPAGPSHLAQLVAVLETPVSAEWAGFGPQKQRGIPFELPRKTPWLHEGGWWNVPDLDAPTRLAAGIDPVYTAPHYRPQIVVPPGQWLALSAMHFAFKRELTPALYQLLMGPDWGYHRFDDIWSGFFAKKVCDHLGQPVTFGGPLVKHEQASNVYTNLVQEAPGIREHEQRWRDIAALPLAGDTVLDTYRSLADGLATFGGEYWPKLAEAMRIWCDLFVSKGGPIRSDGTYYVGWDQRELVIPLPAPIRVAVTLNGHAPARTLSQRLNSRPHANREDL